MGLAISVGALADLTQHDPEGAGWLRQQFEIINKLLAQHKLARFDEPETAVVPADEQPDESFPYGFLHCLRRFAARCKEDKVAPPPLKPREAPERDRAIEEASSLFDFHLLVHSDSEGFYVPLDFEDVIFDNSNLGLAGGMLGSSVRLLGELIRVAPMLQITLSGDTLSAAEQQRIEQQANDEKDPFWRELLCWLTLFRAARASIKYKVAIAFQ
jgi:hypothetical protein